MKKIVGTLLIGFSLSLGIYSWPTVKVYYSEYLFATQWAQSWNSRLKNPTHFKLPKQWNHIRSITIYPTHWKHTLWMKWIDPPIPINPKGKFHLDILVMSWEEEPDKRFVVLQYDLIEIKGRQNTIWEGGQTFKLSLPL